ncbi:MAG: HD domain-containing phosphohydrolase [Planctomycetota bacterium]
MDLASSNGIVEPIVEAPVPATKPPAQESAPNQASPTSGLSSRAVEIVRAIQGSQRQVVRAEHQQMESHIKSCKILIVDDEEANVLIVRQHLKRAGYTSFSTCTDARKVLGLAQQEKPDLILLDINMPHVNGLQILHAINLDRVLCRIPVVILTAEADQNIKQAALELGANDFLTKPVEPAELIPRVRNSLTVKSHFDALGKQKQILEETVRKRTKELFESRKQIILSLARAAEHRDNETGNHVIRVGCYAAIIARQLGWKEKAAEMLQQAAQLHDVGKIGVPDNILFKPGKLDEDEYTVMKKHCALGKSIISPFEAKEKELLRSHTKIGGSILHIQNSPLLTMAARIAQTHHEHWDGTGYPLGLAGEDIPIEGRITAVADVFDALSSKRPYKDPLPRQKCFEILANLGGSQFDPKVLAAFFECSSHIIKVQMALMDE